MIGYLLEMRTTQYADSHLKISPSDKPTHNGVYVLVVGLNLFTYKVVGWIVAGPIIKAGEHSPYWEDTRAASPIAWPATSGVGSPAHSQYGHRASQGGVGQGRVMAPLFWVLAVANS